MDETIVRSATPRPARQAAGGCSAALFNSLALLLVVFSCLIAMAVGALFQFPGVLQAIPGGSALMLRTMPAVAQRLFTATPGAGGPGGRLYPTLPPLWTPSETPTVTGTPLPATETAIPSSTSAFPSSTPTRTKTPTPTRPRPTRAGPTPLPSATRSPFSYTLQAGSPTYLTNFLPDPSGCGWMGIGGRAFGMDGNPVINLTVHMEGGGLNMDTLTGSGPQGLGPGSYKITISDHPIDTTDTYRVQLRNNTGVNLSDVYAIRTYGDCAKNLIMVNFFQNH
jgi:hypothetical protein